MHNGDFAKSVSVGPGARLPEQYDPLDYQEERSATEGVWRRNYATLDGLVDRVVDVMEDQTRRGQILKLTESEARRRYPDLTVASLGASQKEKATGVVTAKVLFDGTMSTDARESEIRNVVRSPRTSNVFSETR